MSISELLKSPLPIADHPSRHSWAVRVLLFSAGIIAWWFVYHGLEPFAKWFTYDLLKMSSGSHLSSAVEFFVFEAPKVMMLLTLVVFGVGSCCSAFSVGKWRRQRREN